MTFPHTITLPTPDEVRERLPLSPQNALRVASYRQKIENLLQGGTGFLIILGPCSIHHVGSALEYGKRVAQLQKELGKDFFLVMRAFLEKPRSWGGWKGFMADPKMSSPPQIHTGITEGRKLLLGLTELGVPIATEFLNPLLAPFTADLVSWGCIGARTTSSPLHRELASLLPLPMGFKNGVDGSIETALQGIVTSRQPQTAIFPDGQGRSELIETKGNPRTHLVLRGGPEGANFDIELLHQIEDRLLKLDLEPKILIDCSHDNSQKDLEQQKANFREVFERYLLGEHRILGAMIESFLERGKGDSPLLSLTDPCLGWEETVDLLKEVLQKV